MLPLFFAVGVIFAPIGGLLLYASSQVQELSIDYSRCNETTFVCDPSAPDKGFGLIPDDAVSTYFKNNTNADTNKPTWCIDRTYVNPVPASNLNISTPVCRIQFYIPDRLKPPVLLYYQLTNFYQNHRRYVKSFDQQQLQGHARNTKDIDGSDCDPLKLGEDNKPYYPCGLIANSKFNDTFSAPIAFNWPGVDTQNYTYPMTDDNIAWSSDADLYKKTDYNYSQVVPPPNWRERYPVYNDTFPFPSLHTDQAFQVWMRTAGLPTFSKLALRNDNVTMEIGRYQMDIQDCKSDQMWIVTT